MVFWLFIGGLVLAWDELTGGSKQEPTKKVKTPPSGGGLLYYFDEDGNVRR